ncbi:hypothetical protein OF83DRAFT_1171485 [Amylostereum chailletii]|nr:hypothetical protein OF83DRAFT_1171485 [Amylostereum chailletii]
MPCVQTSTAPTQKNASLSSDDIEQISKVLASTTSSQTLVPLVVETVFFGVFTLLIIISTYFIIRKSLRSLPHKVMLFATLVMYAGVISSWTSQLYVLFALAKQMNDVQATTSDALDKLQTQGTCSGRAAPTYEDYLKATEGPLNVCVPTALLTVNIAFSGAIVLWRAWVLHSRGRVVLGVSAMLLLATAALSVVDARDTLAFLSFRQLFTGNIYGAAAFLLSWTNVWATSLIIVMTWRGAPAVQEIHRTASRRRKHPYVHGEGDGSLGRVWPAVLSLLDVFGRVPCARYFTQDMPRSMPIAPEVPLRVVVVTAGSSGSDSSVERGSFVTDTDRVCEKAIVGKDEVERYAYVVSPSVRMQPNIRKFIAFCPVHKDATWLGDVQTTPACPSEDPLSPEAG